MQTLTFAPSTVARFAGLMYLIIIACGLYAGLGIREAMLVPGIRLPRPPASLRIRSDSGSASWQTW